MLNHTDDTLLGLQAGLELVRTENVIVEDANRPPRSAIEIDDSPVKNSGELVSKPLPKRVERYGLQSHYRHLAQNDLPAPQQVTTTNRSISATVSNATPSPQLVAAVS